MASVRFWTLYEALPKPVHAVADKNFQLLKSDQRHPSLHFKRIGKLWSVRVGDHHRALGHDVEGGIQWFWIGSHAGLRIIKGFHDEALAGEWKGYRSSRLGDKWRVIYRVLSEELLFQVASVTAHDYRRP